MHGDVLSKMYTRLRRVCGSVQQRNGSGRHFGGLSLALFMREILIDPRAMGAALPSSRRLAYNVANHVSPGVETGLVVELGAGTGVVTAALLERGVAPQRLIVVERAAALAEHLRRRFPHVAVVQGDARHLRRLLKPYASDVRAVVSSLPLRSLPAGWCA